MKSDDYFKELLDNKVQRRVGDKVAESLELFGSTCQAVSQHHVIGHQGMYEVFMLVAVRFVRGGSSGVEVGVVVV